ncbi:MAG TPA: ankyrin repeat domain-containing protein [Propionibacteriaceae bacterium]|nr:ankyrin repeat domain-containing protein [Propionibacteriaceae bacterium]
MDSSSSISIARTAAAIVAVVALGASCTSPAPPPQPTPTASTPKEPTTTPTPPRPKPTGQARLDRELREAAWDNDVRRARALIDRGADVNAKDETEQSAYLIATSEGYLDLLNLTLRHGADVDSKDSFNGTGLIRAADRGHADIAGRLVQAGVDIDHVNNLGWTALHEAILLGDGSRRYVSTVQVLVAAGADVRLPSRRDQVAPLAQAQSKGFDEIAEVLQSTLDAKEISRSAASRQLLAAAEDGDATGVALALRAGADLEVRDDRERTPLLGAVTRDHVATARLLVYLGADPDALDDRHDTPWLVTGVTGSVAMAEVLLPAKPDLKIRNRFGGVSIIPASERGHVDYVRRVVKTDIDVNHVNDLGWTALLEAVILGDGSRRYQEIVTILLDAGADRDLADRDGVTALAHAERRGQNAVAELLR